MRRKFAFLVAVFCATVLAMAVQKPVFMAWYAAEAAGAGFGGWMEVLWHGLTLDMTVAGYVTALPLLAVLLSLWVRIPERVWRGVLTAYFALDRRGDGRDLRRRRRAVRALGVPH